MITLKIGERTFALLLDAVGEEVKKFNALKKDNDLSPFGEELRIDLKRLYGTMHRIFRERCS